MSLLRSTGSTMALVIMVVALLSSVARAQLVADVAGDVGLTANSVKDGGLTFADFDGDGWLDVVVTAKNRGYLFTSRAGTSFTDETDARAPGLRRSGVERSAVAADLNNDGYVDLILSGQSIFEVFINGGPSSDPPFRLGEPDGSASFLLNAATDPALDAYEGVGVLDVNQDGYLDILLENDAELRTYITNAAGGGIAFTLIAAMGLLPPNGSDNGDYIAVTDWDVDGFVDVAQRTSTAALADLFHNDGDGTFTPIVLDTIQSDNGHRGGIDFCDIDNDGDFDFFYTSGSGAGVNHVWVQNDAGTFVDSGQPDVGSSTVDDAACGDLDNDGDVDLYLSRDGTDYVYLNQLTESGSVVWTRSMTTVTANRNGEGAVLVDFDRDGDLDVYVNQWGGSTTDPVTMVTTENPASNALLRNDTGGTSYLAVEVLAAVVTCPSTPVYRTDLGAVVRLEHAASDWASGVHEVNGGEGHGTQGSPIVHVGLPAGASEEYVLTLHFQHGDEPTTRVRVTPSTLGAYQLRTVLASDADADGIETAVERMQSAMFGGEDMDGDGFAAWEDEDSDGDGVPDSVEAGDDDPCTPPVDMDLNGVPDYLEVPGSGDAGPGLDGGGPGFDGGGGGLDAGVGDGGPTSLQAHGSGCARCAIVSREARRDSARSARQTMVGLLIVLGVLGARRRR